MARLEALRQWRKKTARQMGVDSDIVLPRDLLHAITERNPRREEALAKVMHDVPWRLEHFGGQILEVIRKC
jgi:ribonuclease D